MAKKSKLTRCISSFLHPELRKVFRVGDMLTAEQCKGVNKKHLGKSADVEDAEIADD